MKQVASLRDAKRASFWREMLAGRKAFACFYTFDPNERVAMVKEGVPSHFVLVISRNMAIPKDRLYSTIGVARATMNRKVRDKKVLNPDESERVVGLARLEGQVESIVSESGSPEGFDAAKWTATWLEEPQPALGGQRPAELMDTAEGRAMVSDLVARMQSSAYA
jgi:putative toxin-antitoxin system antitoxin component (TIGR02293 family)